MLHTTVPGEENKMKNIIFSFMTSKKAPFTISLERQDKMRLEDTCDIEFLSAS